MTPILNSLTNMKLKKLNNFSYFLINIKLIIFICIWVQENIPWGTRDAFIQKKN